MKKSKKAAMSLTERFDIPDDALPGTAYITITGHRRLHIDRHRGILEYSTEFISVNCDDKIIGVYGMNLELANMDATELLVTGEIQRIEFS